MYIKKINQGGNSNTQTVPQNRIQTCKLTQRKETVDIGNTNKARGK